MSLRVIVACTLKKNIWCGHLAHPQLYINHIQNGEENKMAFHTRSCLVVKLVSCLPKTVFFFKAWLDRIPLAQE